MTVNEAGFRRDPSRMVHWPNVGEVCRLGLATRGNTGLAPEDIDQAVSSGVNYLNWCGHSDGMQEWIRQAGTRRGDVHVAVQFSARTALEAERELQGCLDDLKTDYVDVLTYYYVESEREWDERVGRDGAARVIEDARASGMVRSIGLTSHQRSLAAELIATERLDNLMIRDNAAHRGAERDVFPETDRAGLPVVAFTCQRWGELVRPTPDDPPGFRPPAAPEWYRWVLCQSAVAVALAAPNGSAELEQTLEVLRDWKGQDDRWYQQLCEHGTRVYRHGGGFP